MRVCPGATTAFIEHFVRDTDVTVVFEIGERVWREAARAFASYVAARRAAGGGEAKRLLADFVVGAHAQVRANRLMTLATSRYDRAFPGLTLISA